MPNICTSTTYSGKRTAAELGRKLYIDGNIVISLQSVLAPYNDSRIVYAARERILAATFNYIRRSGRQLVIFPVPGLSNDNLLCHQRSHIFVFDLQC